MALATPSYQYTRLVSVRNSRVSPDRRYLLRKYQSRLSSLLFRGRAITRHHVSPTGLEPVTFGLQPNVLPLALRRRNRDRIRTRNLKLRTLLHFRCASRLYGYLDSNQELWRYKLHVLPFNYIRVHLRGLEPPTVSV